MNRKTGLISIIVPVFNIEEYLERCLNSIINQTYRELEIILVNDGSTDKSGEICNSFEQVDSRIKVIHKRHEGTSSARNVGIELAHGFYVGFVDGDDYLSTDMYEKMLEYMQDDVDIVCCGRVCISQNRKIKMFYTDLPVKFSSEEALEELLLLRKISYSVCTKLFRRSLFDNISFPEGRTCEDIPIVYHLIKRARNVVHIGETKYMNCHRKNSTSGREFYIRKVDNILFSRDIYRDVQKYYPQLAGQAEAAYIRSAFYLIHDIGRSTKRKQYKNIENRLKKFLCKMTFHGIRNKYLNRYEKKLLLQCFFRAMESI